MPMTGANGGLIGTDNTPAAAGDGCVTTITSTGCFCSSSTHATVIIVAGGGGAGRSGGGGGGGTVVVACHPLPGSAIPVTIGGGGAGSCTGATTGADTVFGSTTPITAKGGGGGGGSNSGTHKGKDGGSGGGGGDDGSACMGLSVATNHGCTRAGFSGGKGDHATGGGGGGAGGSGGKRGNAGMGACLLPLGVPKCMGEKGFVGGGGAGHDNTAASDANDAILAGPTARAKTDSRMAPLAMNNSKAMGGMGGGGATLIISPRFNPATPDCNVSNSIAGVANTGGGGGSNGTPTNNTGKAGGSGTIFVVKPAVATINSGIYNIKEQYAAIRGSRWI